MTTDEKLVLAFNLLARAHRAFCGYGMDQEWNNDYARLLREDLIDEPASPNIVSRPGECRSSIYCEHANEVPTVCPCPPDCYCRVKGSCRDL